MPKNAPPPSKMATKMATAERTSFFFFVIKFSPTAVFFIIAEMNAAVK